MSVQVELVRQLESYVQEEIGAQSRTIELLNTQQIALRDASAKGIEAGSRDLELAIRAAGQRAQRRIELVRRLALAWSVAPQTLTLSSIAERAGPDGDRLRRLRDELRQVTARVARSSRLAGALASAHQRLLKEALDVILPKHEDGTTSQSGRLVDAEA